MFPLLCTVSVWTGYFQLGSVAGLLLPVFGVNSVLFQGVCQVEATSPKRKVLDSDGLNTCDTSSFQISNVGSSVLPLFGEF